MSLLLLCATSCPSGDIYKSFVLTGHGPSLFLRSFFDRHSSIRRSTIRPCLVLLLIVVRPTQSTLLGFPPTILGFPQTIQLFSASRQHFSASRQHFSAFGQHRQHFVISILSTTIFILQHYHRYIIYYFFIYAHEFSVTFTALYISTIPKYINLLVRARVSVNTFYTQRIIY